MNLITASIISFLFIAPSAAWSTEMSKQAAQAYIEKFRNDRRSFSGTPQGLVIDGKIDPDGFEVLRQGLLTENQDTRENIITLLLLMNDQVNNSGSSPLTVDLIIQTLATEAIAKDDTASKQAVRELLRQCPKETLEKYNDNYLAAVNRDPSIYMMLLIAKAKTLAARPIIEDLLKTPKWKDNVYAEIAAAALGNTKIEDEYIEIAKHAKTGDGLANAIDNLKNIGTRRSLQTIASFLRSPLVHGWNQTSLRLVAMDALRFNIREDVLRSGFVYSQADYERVEKFVADVLDVHFEGPLPPFYTDTPVPIPLPGQRIQLPKAAP